MESLLTTDIYSLTETVQDLQERYIDTEDPDTLALGMYGYLADIHATILQNSIITTGEMGNELFPSRAKFERNVINHAIIQNIDSINAIPATISAILGIFEEDFDTYMTDDKFIIDKDIAFGIEDFEFHLEYDIIVKRTTLTNNTKSYTAQYDISRTNSLSSITNPYMVAPFVQKYNNKNMIFFYVELMQYKQDTYEKTLITNNMVENKVVLFNFEDQLADFEVKVTDGDTVKYLTPVFEGMGLENNLTDFCYYSYADSSHIRVRFDSISYVPKINAKIEINIKTTKGSEGNFEYIKELFPIIKSDRFNYKSLYTTLQFVTKSSGGKDRKTTDELRKMLPKEALSRGSITCTQDLENYFNMLDTDLNRLIIQKRVDNQFERSYFAYMILKDSYGNVVPTNTFDIDLKVGDFYSHVNRKYVLKPGAIIVYDDIDNNKAYVLPNTEDNADKINELTSDDRSNFVYTCPFMLVVTDDPLYVSYYLTLVNTIGQLEFTFVNVNSLIQFICTNVKWYRKYNTNPNSYFMEFAFAPNATTNISLITIDSNNKVVDNKLKVYAVFFNYENSDEPFAYAECQYVKNYDETVDSSYVYRLELTTEDKLSDDNKIYISGLTRASGTESTTLLLTPSVGVKIYICVNLDDEYGVFSGRANIDNIVPGLEKYTVANMYTVDGGLKFYENYTEVISSQVSDIQVEGEYTSSNGFHVMRVPCIRRSYAENEENISEFIENINYKKAYIDNALYVLEDNFLIDFKFFNTYGPSRTYTMSKNGTDLIDRVNLTIEFELKLLTNSDKNTKDYIARDIKEYIEDLNDISSLHIPNLITDITTNYRESIEYLEFKGFNGYGPGVQHIYRQDYNVLTGTQDVNMIPEFLTIHTDQDMTPNIVINLA